MSTETTRLQGENNELRTKLRIMRTKLSSINSSRRFTLDELLTSSASLEEECDELLARLEPLRSGNAAPVSKEEREAMQRDELKWTAMEKRRKEIRNDMKAHVKDCVGENFTEVMVRCGWS
jgi:hypothetical protein